MLFDKKLGKMKSSFDDFEEDIVLDEDVEVLNELCIYDDNKGNYSIQVNPTHNHNHGDTDSYFKFYNSVKINRSSPCCRVNLFTAEFIKHDGATFYPTSTDKRNLVKILNTKINPGFVSRMLDNWNVLELYDVNNYKTVWDILKLGYNIALAKYSPEEIKTVSCSMREFNKTYYYDLVPYDLPMPDYRTAEFRKKK